MAEKANPNQPGQPEQPLPIGQQTPQLSSIPGQQQTISHPPLMGQPNQQIGRPQLIVHQDKELSRIRRFFQEPYTICQPYAQNVKIVFQMLVGAVLALLIILKFIHHFFVLSSLIGPLGNGFWSPSILFLHTFVYNLPTLDIVGLALAFSTAFELAYTLFTPGPDEAVEPLITGLAAVILFLISRISTVTFDSAGGIALLVLALIGLFILRYFFIEEKKGVHLFRGNAADKPTSAQLTSKTNGTNTSSTSHPSEL